MGHGGEAGAAGRDRSDSTGVGPRPTESSEVDRSIGAARFHKGAEVSARLPQGVKGAAAFVELLAASTGTAISCLVEVESICGSKLRLELKGIATSQLAELIRALAAS